jgi:NitT/TauT family transport system substrate-binding protein
MHRRARAAAALGVAAVLCSCGSSGDASSGRGLSSASPTSVQVAETAGIPSSFLGYGKSQGFFSKRGLDLKIDTSVGGAAVVPAITSGNIQFGGSNITSVLLASSKGLPLAVVAGGTYATQTPKEDFSAVLVGPNSPITSPSDLAGKTIAVNTLRSIGDITIKASLEKQGVDVTDIKFLETGFPEMLPLLAKGDVDAVWEIEPFVTIGRTQGFRPVLWPYVAAQPGLMVGSYITSKDYLADHADVVRAFRAGVAETAKSIASDPAAFRAAIPSLAKTSPEVAKKLVLPQWNGAVDVDSLTWMAGEMKKYGLVDKGVDVNAVVAPGASG